MFAAPLDSDDGGFYRIASTDPRMVTEQLYLPDTGVLITRFLSPDGVSDPDSQRRFSDTSIDAAAQDQTRLDSRSRPIPSPRARTITKPLEVTTMPTKTSSDPTPRIAIVTGGSRGIGRSLVEHLARDGLSVVVVYATNRPEAEAAVAGVKSQGAAAIAVRADIADEHAVADVFDLGERQARTVPRCGRPVPQRADGAGSRRSRCALDGAPVRPNGAWKGR